MTASTAGRRGPGSLHRPVEPAHREHEIVPPGATINLADNMWTVGTIALDAAFRRR